MVCSGLEIRSELIGRMVEAPLAELLTAESKVKVLNYFHRIIQDERLYAVGFCDHDGKVAYKTLTYPDSIPCDGAGTIKAGQTALYSSTEGPSMWRLWESKGTDGSWGRLMLVHDMSWVERRSSDTKWYLYYLFAIIGAVISLVTVLVAHLSWLGWVSGVRAMLRGEGLVALIGNQQPDDDLHPVAQDLRASFMISKRINA